MHPEEGRQGFDTGYQDDQPFKIWSAEKQLEQFFEGSNLVSILK